MDPVTDAHIGRYRRLFVVGRGSFATVYGGYDDALGIAVALKVLDARHAADADVRGRFVNEARLLREATSPHLVRVHDLRETDDGRPYMVLDFADRGTVADRIGRLRTAGRMPTPAELVSFARQVGDGVTEVHERLRVVHRDLKPSNLLLTTHSTAEPFDAAPEVTTDHVDLVAPDEVLLVADFGLARDLDRSSLTVSAGTLGYMAPEQLQAGRPVTAAADLYALTAIVHELVVGHAPGALGFDAAAVAPAWIAPFLAKGLAVDPAHRHRSAREWTDELVAAATGGAVPSPRISRRTVLFGAGVAAAAGVGGAIAAATWLGGGPDRVASGTGTTTTATTATATATTATAASVTTTPAVSASEPTTTIAAAVVELVAPQRLVADGRGGVVVADGQQVVAIAADGATTRLAGTGQKGVGGTGPATSIALDDVGGVAAGAIAGEWLIADAGGGVVYRLTASGELVVVTRVFNQPIDVLDDGAGGVVIVDGDTQAVHRVLGDGSEVEELVGRTPVSLASDLDRRLVIGDAATKELHLVDDTADEVIDLASSPIGTVGGIAVFKNGYLVADPTANRVWRVDGADEVTPFAGTGDATASGDGGAAIDAGLAEPIDVAVDATGAVFVLERARRAVRVVYPDGTISTLGRGLPQPR